jgi:PKD domain
LKGKGEGKVARPRSLAFCVIVACLLCIALIAKARAATIIFNEGFEGAFPGSSWTVGDSNTANGLDFWDDISYRSHTGSWSAWCAGNGATYYNTTVWSENFEAPFPTADYQVLDYETASGLDMWDDTPYRAHSGLWSAWCAQIGTQIDGQEIVSNSAVHRYDNNMLTHFLRWADLSSYSFATLSYWYWIESEPTYDWFCVAYHTSTQGGGENSYVNIVSGNSNGWQYREVVLPSNTVWVAFQFGSDSTNYNHEGAYVDDIVLTGCKEYANTYNFKYDDNMDAYMTRPVNLSGYSWVMLTYWYWSRTESTAATDYLAVMYHTSSGWTYTDTHYGQNSSAFTYSAVNLTLGADQVGFVFHSDSSIRYEGSYLDDVMLIGYHIPTGSITINGGATYASSTSATLSLNYTAYGTTVSQVRYSNDGSGWTTWEAPAPTKSWNLASSDGQKTVYYQIKDAEDLVSSALSDTITLDTTPPSGSIRINSDATYTSSTAVSLSLTASDAASGVAQARYSNDGSSWTTWETYSTIKSWTLNSGDGAKTVYYQIKDNLGLTSSTYSDSIVLDTAPPTGSILINNGNPDVGGTGVSLSLSYADAGSGVSQVRYSNDGATWTSWEPPAATRGWSLSAGDGTKTVYFQVKDSAGLVSSPYSDSILMDTYPPQGSIQINNGATYTNVTGVSLALLATDAGSGVWGMRFSNDGATYTTWETYATAKTWSLVGGPGTKYVYAQFIDNVDLTVTAYDTVILDTILPVANAGQNQNVQIGQTVTFNGGGSSDNIGVASYLWSFGDGTTGTGVTTNHTYSSVGTYTVSLMVKDLAGNSAASSSSVTVEVAIPELPSTAILLLLLTFASVLACRSRVKLRSK